MTRFTGAQRLFYAVDHTPAAPASPPTPEAPQTETAQAAAKKLDSSKILKYLSKKKSELEKKLLQTQINSQQQASSTSQNTAPTQPVKMFTIDTKALIAKVIETLVTYVNEA